MSEIHTRHTSNARGTGQVRATYKGKSLTTEIDHSYNAEKNHRIAAERLAAKLDLSIDPEPASELRHRSGSGFGGYGWRVRERNPSRRYSHRPHPGPTLGNVDYSQQAYRGYLIRTNALTHEMWIEKDGHLIHRVPADKSWAYARAEIDKLTGRESNPGRGSVHTAKWDRCFEDVKARGGAYSPAAVCTAALGERGSIKPGHRRKNPDPYIDPAVKTAVKQTMQEFREIMRKGTMTRGAALHVASSNAAHRLSLRKDQREAQMRLVKSELERSRNPSQWRRISDSPPTWRRDYGDAIYLITHRNDLFTLSAEAMDGDMYDYGAFETLAGAKRAISSSNYRRRDPNPLPKTDFIRRVYYVARARKGHEVWYLTRGGKLMRGEPHAARYATIAEAKAAAVAHLRKFPHSRAYKFEVALAY